MAVEVIPVNIERIRPVVLLRMKRLNALPDRSLIDSSNKNIPNMKIPSPAKNFHISKSSNIVLSYSFEYRTNHQQLQG
jgi:hypothetical protein